MIPVTIYESIAQAIWVEFHSLLSAPPAWSTASLPQRGAYLGAARAAFALADPAVRADERAGLSAIGSTAAARDVLSERHRQQSAEGWTPQHDDTHRAGQMADAAACYAASFRVFKQQEVVGLNYETYTQYVEGWPWSENWWKPRDRRRDLIRAGALILAELDRLDRLPTAPPNEVPG